jgi:hypothetical protein
VCSSDLKHPRRKKKPDVSYCGDFYDPGGFSFSDVSYAARTGRNINRLVGIVGCRIFAGFGQYVDEFLYTEEES